MAVLALAAAGAALAPAGYAAIGWTVGSVVGQLLFPGSLPDQVGPRVGDLRAQQSQYGVAIPILYGTTRVAGNVIWSTDLIETVTTNEVGKGGPSQTQTTYSYRVSMAIMLGEGPITGVRRIWADGKLVYNVSASADTLTASASAQLAPGLTFYPGNETQLPDPTLEAYLGVGNVPAYRGRAYLVFSDLQLEAYGNRRPNITAEIVAAGTTGSQVAYGTMPYTASITRYVAAATDGDTIIALDVGAPCRITRSEDGGVTWSPLLALGPTANNGFDITYGGGLWVVSAGGHFYWSADGGFSWTQITAPALQCARVRYNGSIWVAVGQNGFGYSYDGKVWTSVAAPSAVAWVDVCWVGSQWVALAATGATAISLFGTDWSLGTSIGFGATWTKLAFSGTALVAVRTGAVQGARSTDAGASWATNSMPTGTWKGVEFDGERFVACGASLTSAAATSDDDGVNWTAFNQPNNEGYGSMVVTNGLAVFVSDDTGLNPDALSAIWRFGVLSPSVVTLSTIVSDLCTRAGLGAGDIDVTALTDAVDGYAVGQQMSVRSAIEPLQRLANFDAIESDGKIVFRKRGGASVVTIPADDLAAASAGDSLPDDLSMSRQQEPELPAVVSVVYIDKDADYQQNTQQSQRITTLSRQQTAVEMAIAMSADRARAIAETLMYDAWTQRQRYTFRTSRQYAALEPADVVTVARNGTTHTLRIQRKTESRSGVIEFEAVAEEASVYTQSVTGGSALVPSDDVRRPPATFFAPMDIPLLRDEDNSLGFYGAAAGLTDGWRGAVIYRSADDGATYDENGAIVNASAIGYAISAMPAAANPHMFDETNLVNVDMIEGSLSSATETAVLNGANAIMIGAEILQFKGALLYAPNKYQLSGLLRGRRGTERAMTTHVIGERVVLLTAAALRRFPADLNAARLFRPVSIGRTVQETAPQSFTYTGVNLEPFAPVELGGGRNAAGDLTITWRRRSRLGVNLPAFYDPPLGEASESYDVEIWNSLFSVLRRTIAGVTAQTTTYTAAQQTTDAGGLQSIVYVRVFQNSALVGRGYVLQGSI